MCGIAIDWKNWKFKRKNWNIILETKHRGPDDSGFYFEKNLALGSNRLSIFDLTENGKMPFKINLEDIIFLIMVKYITI